MAAVTRVAQVTPFLWFDGNAEEAVEFYVSVFPAARKLDALINPGEAPGPKGKPLAVGFEIGGLRFTALNGGPGFPFTQAVSFVVHCVDQAEIDYYWERLSEGGQEIQCGWLKDRYGLFWQIVPENIFELVKTSKGMLAMMGMVKFDIAALERAAKE